VRFSPSQESTIPKVNAGSALDLASLATGRAAIMRLTSSHRVIQVEFSAVWTDFTKMKTQASATMAA
jgi:hypothetical protein